MVMNEAICGILDLAGNALILGCRSNMWCSDQRFHLFIHFQTWLAKIRVPPASVDELLSESGFDSVTVPSLSVAGGSKRDSTA